MGELSHIELLQGDNTRQYKGKRQTELSHVGIPQCDKIRQYDGKRQAELSHLGFSVATNTSI